MTPTGKSETVVSNKKLELPTGKSVEEKKGEQSLALARLSRPPNEGRKGMNELSYHVTGLIRLYLENYHNAGLTPEETKSIIEKILDDVPSRRDWGFFPGNLRCISQGINHNWNVHTRFTHPEDIRFLVGEIKFELDRALNQKEESDASRN